MSILQDLLALKQPIETIVEAEDLNPHEAKEAAEELEELHDKMVKLMAEVRAVIRGLPRHMRGQPESYWIPHIMIALGGEHEWMTAGHESTMEKTIEELKEYAAGGDWEGDDEDEDSDDSDHDDHGPDPMGRHHGRNY